jgi:hypothetical protein
MKRNKSKFEKFFSFSRYKRRFKADKLSSLIDTNFLLQKNTIIDTDKTIYTHGSSDDLEEHFKELKSEFHGQSELCFTHAKIIVLIRREYKTSKYFKIFVSLWNEHYKFLLENLNSRWLISAADTYSDHSSNESEKEIALIANIFTNTIKLYESERFLLNLSECRDDQQKQKQLDDGIRFPLHDGLSVFKFGTDDTLRNMKWRIDKIKKKNIPAKIFYELFNRAQNFDTVFLRAKKRHNRRKTEWWD